MKPTTRYVVSLFLWMNALVFICALFMGCNTFKKTQAKKDYEASIAHSKLLEEMRAVFPCDTSHIVVTKTDTAFVFVSDTTYKNDTVFITRIKTVTNTVYRTATVVDSAYGQLWKDRYDQAGYLLQNSKDQSDKIAASNTVKDMQIEALKPWKSRAISTWVIVGLAAAALLYLKFKP